MASAVAPSQRRYTVDDLDDMDWSVARYELLDGELLVTSAPFNWHQVIQHRLYDMIKSQLAGGWSCWQANGILLGSDTMLVPDLSIIRSEAVRRDVKYPAAADVALVLEVESDSTRYRDRGPKKNAYAKAGIPTYVRVEFARDGAPTLVVQELRASGYVVAGRSGPVGRFEFRVAISQAIRIDMDELNAD